MTSRSKEARPSAASRNDVTGDRLISKQTNDAYRENWDRIFGELKDIPKNTGTCQCTMSKKLLGDGCQHCNPGYMKELEEEEHNADSTD